MIRVFSRMLFSTDNFVVDVSARIGVDEFIGVGICLGVIIGDGYCDAGPSEGDDVQ